MLNEKELEEIRRKLLELEEEPPVAAWKHIQQEIKPDKKRPLIWWLPLALLLLLTGAGVLLVQNEKMKPTQAQEQTIPETAAAPAKQHEKPVSEIEKGTFILPEAGQARAQAAKSVNKSKPPSSEISNPASVVSAKNIITTSTGFKTNTGIPVLQPAILTDTVKAGAREETTIRNSTESMAAVVSENRNEEEYAADSNGEIAVVAPFLQDSVTVDSESAVVADIDSTQQEAAKKPKVRKQREPGSWTLGLVVTPRYAFRKFSPNTQDEILITQMKNVNKPDPKRMGFEYGISASKVVSPTLSLDAGISLMQLNENLSYNYTLGKMDSSAVKVSKNSDGSVAVSSGYLVKERKLESTYTYGGLRLGATYYFGQNGHRRFNLTAAAGANLLVKGRTKQYINGAWTETIYFPSKENILEQSNYNLLLGIGYNTMLHRRLELTVMPTLNYFLTSTFIEREPFGLRPYSLGLTLQVKRIM